MAVPTTRSALSPNSLPVTISTIATVAPVQRAAIRVATSARFAS
jgi:hypothetical protein